MTFGKHEYYFSFVRTLAIGTLVRIDNVRMTNVRK